MILMVIDTDEIYVLAGKTSTGTALEFVGKELEAWEDEKQ